jgi:hypothetical protein
MFHLDNQLSIQILIIYYALPQNYINTYGEVRHHKCLTVILGNWCFYLRVVTDHQERGSINFYSSL